VGRWWKSLYFFFWQGGKEGRRGELLPHLLRATLFLMGLAHLVASFVRFQTR
jgi:hypothetical protein